MSAEPSAERRPAGEQLRLAAEAVVHFWDKLRPGDDPCETLWIPIASIKTALAAEAPSPAADIAGLIDAVERTGDVARSLRDEKLRAYNAALAALRLACGVAT